MDKIYLQPKEENWANLCHQINQTTVQHVQITISRKILHIECMHVVQHKCSKPERKTKSVWFCKGGLTVCHRPFAKDF